MVFRVLFLFLFLISSSTFAGWKESGERLHFDVHFGWIKAGEAELLYRPKPNKTEGDYTLTGRAWTTGLSSVFRLRDRLQATGVHVPMLFAVKHYALDLNEKDYTAHKTVDFLRLNNEAVYTNVHAKEAPNSFAIRKESRDMMSSMYALRAEEDLLNIGVSKTLPVVNLDSTYLMTATVEGKEKMDTVFGEREVWRIGLTFTQDGQKEKAGNWVFWITADDKKYPVRIEAKMRFGAFTATLKDYGNPEMVSRAPDDLPETGKINLARWVPAHMLN